MRIDQKLVQRLVASQFPQWKDLPIRPVESGGWDNRTFHLGETMLARLPSAEKYAAQVKKEQHWLPKLAPLLPLAIPKPLALGRPALGYPWNWSIYRWIDGESAAVADIGDHCAFAADLAQFLLALHRLDTTGGPLPGWHNFHRGGSLTHYDLEVRQAITALDGRIDRTLATEVWEGALATLWQGVPVFVHGDVAIGNLLVRGGRLQAVIDMGLLAIGDPACDLTIAWTLFEQNSRQVFRQLLPFDADTWARGRAWTLWKALIVVAGHTSTNGVDASQDWWRIIDAVLDEHQRDS